MLYKVEYSLDSDVKTHSRIYSALDKGTAKSMFKETCNHGSLIGSRVKIINVSKIKKSNLKGDLS